jgi:hypothetical protein
VVLLAKTVEREKNRYSIILTGTRSASCKIAYV